MKTVLITGGTGFLGSNLAIRLVRKGNRVICVDNNYTGNLDNLAEIADNANFRFIFHDIVQPLEINESIDQIYNLACPASPPKYQAPYSIQTIKTNIYGACNMLSLAGRHNAVILQSSTSEVYGNPAVHPQTESYFGNVNPIGPRACYDEGKRCAESLFFEHFRNFGTRIKIVRLFNSYGPKMAADDGRVVSNFIIQALGGKDITIYGDGSHTRSFCFVDDTIEGMIRMMNSPDDFNGPVNIGNPAEFTIRELAEMVLEKLGGNSRVIYEALPTDDPARRRPDISLARDVLGWAPTVSLTIGLDKTIEYFKGKI
ncbi:MAG: SDR family oxidoreductase [Rickettsiales bacterium]|jgi:UDP-glucuronate decarboxylase|nr:SDR family oxidoreductase [Rickettsiales bacterium]